jgi:hypothetical protein
MALVHGITAHLTEACHIEMKRDGSHAMLASYAVLSLTGTTNTLAICISPASDDVGVALAAGYFIKTKANHADFRMELFRSVYGLCDFSFSDGEHFGGVPFPLKRNLLNESILYHWYRYVKLFIAESVRLLYTIGID